MLRWIAGTVLSLAVCAACASSIIGQAAPDPAGPKLPTRPRELRINGLDPCSTLTGEQLKLLGVQFYSVIEPGTNRGPGCDWIHTQTEPVESYTVDINTRGGVELAFGQPQLEIITIAGFGAVDTPGLFSSGQLECVVNIDVAPGQAVQVGYFYNGRTMAMTHEIACTKARNAAELAMRTILAKLGG